MAKETTTAKKAQDWSVQMKNGSVITIAGVFTCEKDGSGMRLRDEEGAILASFDDGQSTAAWPSGATIEKPKAE